MGDVEEPAKATIKEAVAAAKRFLIELKDSGLLGGYAIKDIVLEEVDQTPEGDWLITLGYRQPSMLEEAAAGAAFSIASLRPQRSEFFKRFKVNRAGEVLAMHLRDPVRG